MSFSLNWPKLLSLTDDRNDVTNCSVNQEYVTQSISNRIKVSLNASDDTHTKILCRWSGSIYRNKCTAI